MNPSPLICPAGPILITGATGFIGRHVMAIGGALGAEIHTYGRRPSAGPAPDQAAAESRRIEGWHSRVIHHAGDLENAALLRHTIADVAPRAILHLAAAGVSYGQNDRAALLRINALPLIDLLDAAGALAVLPSVVCVGSGFEYAPLRRARRESDPAWPHSAYGASKAAATAIASTYAKHLPVTVLRPFSMYGVGEPASRFAAYLIAQAKAGLPVELTAGEQLRDYIDAIDLALICWRALSDQPLLGTFRVLNVASGMPITLRAFGEAVAAALARAGCAADLRFGARPYRSDEMMDYTADVSLLQSTLGWLPTTPLAGGLDRMVAAHLALP